MYLVVKQSYYLEFVFLFSTVRIFLQNDDISLCVILRYNVYIYIYIYNVIMIFSLSSSLLIAQSHCTIPVSHYFVVRFKMWLGATTRVVEL